MTLDERSHVIAADVLRRYAMTYQLYHDTTDQRVKARGEKVVVREAELLVREHLKEFMLELPPKT